MSLTLQAYSLPLSYQGSPISLLLSLLSTKGLSSSASLFVLLAASCSIQGTFLYKASLNILQNFPSLPRLFMAPLIKVLFSGLIIVFRA